MTFSLAAHDPRTGAFGLVVTSSSPAVAARCLHLRAGVGAVSSQNVTNPALGPQVLALLEEGRDAQSALDEALRGEPHPAHRQLTVVDGEGRTANFSGEHSLGVHAVASGDHCVAAGNLLAVDTVPQAIVEAFHGSTGATLEERLLDAVDGGLREGGETGTLRSVGLAVVEDVPWAVTDLRVDDADEPLSELRRLLSLWLVQKADYRTRALDPTAAPSYRVPGDE